MIEDLREKINKHTEEAGQKNSPRDRVCKSCGKKPVCFGIHERRERLFLLIVGNTVQKILSYLIRWKCYRCDGTFTEYPEWTEPYKRYLRDQMIDKSLTYSATEDLSYRKSMPDFYENSEEDGKIDDTNPSHVTLWNWVGYVGSWSARLSKVLTLIMGKDPESKVSRDFEPVDPSKYRSERRRELLEVCMKFWLIRSEFTRLFPKQNMFSPDF